MTRAKAPIPSSSRAYSRTGLESRSDHRPNAAAPRVVPIMNAAKTVADAQAVTPKARDNSR